MEEKDPELWRLARKRAKFKRHLVTYCIINIFFWVIWILNMHDPDEGRFPWPIWPMLGWGLGLAFQYFDAYHTEMGSSAEKEYEKLKKKI
jgi:hypothetical protein